jgi:hypothetical protein
LADNFEFFFRTRVFALVVIWKTFDTFWPKSAEFFFTTKQRNVEQKATATVVQWSAPLLQEHKIRVWILPSPKSPLWAGWPDWENFRHSGRLFTMGRFPKIT